jgi:RNA-binding protein YhbY
MLAERLERTQLVQVIGRTLVLYRPYLENPKIRLPKRSIRDEE